MGLKETTGTQLEIVEKPSQEANDLGVILFVHGDEQDCALDEAKVLNREGDYL